MPYVVTGEFESEADAEEFFERLRADSPDRAAEAITLPGGRRLAFDRYLNPLRGKPNAGHAED
jgi:hypothetical protein